MPVPPRSTDIGVVLDLMIHDLDVVLAFVKSPVVSMDAVGIPVLSQSEDIANARLRFANGCVANLTASRVSPEKMRKIRVFSAGPVTSYISLDYRAQEGFIYRIAREGEGFDHRERVRRQTDRAGTGAAAEGGTAQTGAATFHRIGARAPDTARQRRISQARAGSGV